MTAKYRKYLKSNKWKQIREVVLDRDEHTCQECGSTSASIVHHKTYKHIFEEARHLDDLITLCINCHQDKHPIETGLNETVSRLDERRNYTKVYQIAMEEIQFSQWSYKGIWFRLICNLYRNSNIIYRRKTNNCLALIHTKTELMNLADVSRKPFNKFYQDCMDKDYMRILNSDNELIGKVYTINPYYARNGFGLIESVYNLWRDVIEDLII